MITDSYLANVLRTRTQVHSVRASARACCLQYPPCPRWGWRSVNPAGTIAVIPQCRAHGASLERDDDGGGRCIRSDHTAGKRCQSFNGEKFNVILKRRRRNYVCLNFVSCAVWRLVTLAAVCFLSVFVVKCVQLFFFLLKTGGDDAWRRKETETRSLS